MKNIHKFVLFVFALLIVFISYRAYSANGQSIITVSRNSAVGTQTVALGAKNVKIGSYVFTPPGSEFVKVTSLGVTMYSLHDDGDKFKNLKVMVNGSQFGQTLATVTNTNAFTFYGILPLPGSSVVVDFYADVLPSAVLGVQSHATILSTCFGNNRQNSQVVCDPRSTLGQDVIVQ